MTPNFDLTVALAIIFIFILIRLLWFRELNKPSPPVGVISGTTKDVTGTIVPGVTVTLYAADQITEIAVTTSDATGKYVLPAEAMGAYHITGYLANADGTWLQADQDVTLATPTLTVDLSLVKTTTAGC
jgi:hypothetical protein